MAFGSESAGFRGFRLWRWVAERADGNAFVGARRHNRAELRRAVHAKVSKIVWEGGCYAFGTVWIQCCKASCNYELIACAG